MLVPTAPQLTTPDAHFHVLIRDSMYPATQHTSNTAWTDFDDAADWLSHMLMINHVRADVRGEHFHTETPDEKGMLFIFDESGEVVEFHIDECLSHCPTNLLKGSIDPLTNV